MLHLVANVLLMLLLLLYLPVPFFPAQQPDDSRLQQYSQAAEKALAEQRYGDAEKAYEKLRELDPGTAEVHANLGAIYFQEKKFEQAVPSLRQALKLKPNLARSEALLALSLSELGRFPEALPGLEKGFRRSNDLDVKRMCGLQLERAYTGLRRDDKAVGVALELNQLFPTDPEVLYHTGRLFGNFSYLSAKKLQEVAPTSLWMHLTGGDIYESQAHYDLALGEYRTVLALDPDHVGIHFRIGRVLLARAQSTASASDSGEAKKEFEQELELDPTNANAAYELAELCRKAGERDKARGLFETALKYYPDFEEAQVGLSRVLIVSGKPDLALPHLRKAVALNPDDAVCYFHLSQAYRALRNPVEQHKAMAEFQRRQSQRERDERASIRGALSPQAATKQEIDSETAP